MIKANTHVYGVIGDPIEHSLSPALQNWLFKQFDLNAVYTAFQVHPQNLKEAVQAMSALNLKGLNVTLPHKAAVVEYCDKRSGDVDCLGVANTLSRESSGVSASVTDPQGFIESLGQMRTQFKDAEVCVLGAGGAARSILFALATLETGPVWVYNRTREKAEHLIRESKQAFGLSRARTLSESELNAAIESCRMVINTTSVGMYPQTDASPVRDDAPFSDQHFVYDLIYNPVTTRLLQIAEQKGAHTRNGLDMLIFQGLESLRIWTHADLRLSISQLNECRTLLKEQLYE